MQKKIEKIKYFFQQVSIVTNVIVGFPGESNKHFMNIKSEREHLSVFRIHGILFKSNKVLRSLSEIKRYKFYAKNTVILYGGTDYYIRVKLTCFTCLKLLPISHKM